LAFIALLSPVNDASDLKTAYSFLRRFEGALENNSKSRMTCDRCN